MKSNSFHSRAGDPIEELKSTKIWQRLLSLNEARAEAVCDFVRLIDPYLRDISLHFPLYTRHDCHHGFQVLERMKDIIIPSLLEDDPNSFSDDELLSLIISAYAHDVGMTVFEEGSKKVALFRSLNLPADVDDENEQLCRYLREKHAERGSEFLIATEAGSKVPESLRGLIGCIMKGHNLTPKMLMDEIPQEAAFGRKSADPRALSLILCCADAIEYSDTRVFDSAHDEAVRRGDEDAKESLIHMKKHRAIGGSLAVNDEGFIVATGTFQDVKIMHAAHMTLDQIEEWLKQYIIHASRLKRAVLRLKNPCIIREAFVTHGFRYHPIAIRIDESQIKELFSGQQLWGREPGLPIKELLQNAVDACRYRKHISSSSSQYEPMIEIIIDQSSRKITVSDNGCGMDEHDIMEYFLQLGKSKTRSQEFRSDRVNQGFHPIARFGLGFWSVFAISKSANVKTRLSIPRESKGIRFHVTMVPPMRYLELREDDCITEGTSVTLDLNDDVDLSLLSTQLSLYMSAAPVPMIIKDGQGKLMNQFPVSMPLPQLDDFFDYRSGEARSAGIEWFNCSRDNKDIECRMGIAYSIIDGKPRCLTTEGKYMLSLRPFGAPNLSQVSVCGFRINTDIEPLPFAFGRTGTVSINIRDPR